MKNFLIYILLIFFFCSYSYSQSDFATSAEKNTANPVENDSVTTPEESSQEPALQTGDTQNFVWLIYHPTSSGTAFPIGPNLFVTNFHVLCSMLEEESSIKDVTFHQKGDVFHLTIKRVVAVSALYDLVLFETEESVTNYLNISDIPVRPNEEFLIPGYPQNNFKEMKKTGKAVDNGYHYNFPVNHYSLLGSSGSPVLNTKRQIVGVATLASTNILSAVKSKHLKRLISGDTGLNCSNLSLVICREEEIKNLKKFADQGDALAQNNLSLLYYDGKGVEKNLELAVYWWKKAAEQEDAESQYNLSRMYYNGEGVEKNLELAFYWTQQSAEQGYASAQLNLSRMYFNGKGIEKNLELAFFWIQKSAEQGDAFAQYNLSRMYSNGEGVEKNLKLAFYWTQQSAEHGIPESQNSLSLMYSNGEGVEKNLELAFYWMQRSAEQGYALAQHNLSLMYYNGVGTERNLELAFHWMQQSAKQGDAESQYVLSLMYYNGEGVEKNLKLAFYWMQQSAMQSFFPAQKFLEDLYKSPS